MTHPFIQRTALFIMSFFVPTLALAQSRGNGVCDAIKLNSLFNILIWIKCFIVNAIIPLIFALAFLFFLWGIFKFMRASDAKSKQESQKLIWWGLIGLFVMVSVWGIIKILGTTLGIESTVPMLQTEYLTPQNATP